MGGAPREAAVCFTDPATGTVFVSLGLGAKGVEFTDTYYFNDEDEGRLNWKKVTGDEFWNFQQKRKEKILVMVVTLPWLS